MIAAFVIMDFSDRISLEQYRISISILSAKIFFSYILYRFATIAIIGDHTRFTKELLQGKRDDK